jgi:hypothetical protein
LKYSDIKNFEELSCIFLYFLESSKFFIINILMIKRGKRKRKDYIAEKKYIKIFTFPKFEIKKLEINILQIFLMQIKRNLNFVFFLFFLKI